VRKVAHDQTFQVLLTYVEIPYGIARVFSGKLQEGVGDLHGAIELFSRWGNSRMVAWAHLALGEIWLHQAASDNSLFQENLDKAKRHLEEAIRIGQKANADGHVAEAMLNLSLLAKASEQFDVATNYLERARSVAAPLGWPELTGRIQTTLADLQQQPRI
jgi:tetratricopeptide (TPR) repeat protein